MKNKVINIAIIMLSIFFVSIGNVFADSKSVPISVNDIDYDTYVIGTHMFTTNRTYLSTEDIMWASRTIETNSKDDMIIYYKDYNGDWINGLTAEPITTPSTFNITEIDGESAKAITINYVEDNTNYKVIDSMFYDETTLALINNEDDIDYTVFLNAYNFDNGSYPYYMKCSGYDEDDNDINLDLGITSKIIDIQDGEAYLPIKVSKDAPKGFYSCELNIDDEPYYMGIVIGKSQPTFVTDHMNVGTHEYDENGEVYGLGSYSVHAREYNEFYIQNYENSEILDLDFYLHTYFMNEGAHTFDLKVYDREYCDDECADVEPLDVFEVPSNINVEYNSVIGIYDTNISLPIKNQLEKGEYELDVYIDGDLAGMIILHVQESTKVELEKLYNKTDGYEIEESNIITNEKKKTYTASFKTTNIPDGTYQIESYIEAFSVREHRDLDSYKTVEIKNNKFDLDFVIPSDLPPADYNINVDIIDEYNAPIGNTLFIFPIKSNSSTGIEFIKNSDISEGYEDSYLFGRSVEDGNGFLKLSFATKGYVDGFHIYSLLPGFSEYVFLEEVLDIYHAENENEQSYGSYNVHSRYNKTISYKIKPYIINDDHQIVYLDESNIVSYEDNPYTWLGFKWNNNPGGSPEHEVEYDNEDNATLTVQSSIMKKDYLDGYIIEESNDNGLSFSTIKEFIVGKNIYFNEYNISREEFKVTIPKDETRIYRIKGYVALSNGEKSWTSEKSITYTNRK